MQQIARELWHFGIANARASQFGAFLLAVFLVTELIAVPGLARYDVIFLAAVAFQASALLFRFEGVREFAVILIFHLLATLMELFKTHPDIASWVYPGLPGTFFAIATIPLFTGFLYSAVGSYISRAFYFLRLRFEHFPAYYHLWVMAVLIYVNFFTHHYMLDIRYVLFASVLFIFGKTRIYYQVYTKERAMPFLVAALLTAFFVWVAENVGTFTHIWLYPSQLHAWHLVSFAKIGSWFLLLMLSFALVSIIYRDKLRP